MFYYKFNPKLDSGYFSLSSLMKMKNYTDIEKFERDYQIQIAKTDSGTIIFNVRKHPDQPEKGEL